MSTKTSYLTFLFVGFFVLFQSAAQKTDPKDPPTRKRFLHNIFQKAMRSVTVSKKDSAIKATVIYNRSERPYVNYQGKVIRKIRIRELGFEKVFTDTSKVIKYYGTRLLNALHTDTWDWVIRDNLFIREGSRLNRYLVADNERHLRTLDFIQDVRIIARPITGSTDSVDLEVITKDLFSITGSLELNSAKRQKFKISENNLAGAGQKVQLSALVDQRRHPTFGYDLLYAKNSILHSFVNATVGYTKIFPDRQGDEGVRSFYVQLSRPLVSAYTRVAGGVQVNLDKAYNSFLRPDSSFYQYQNSYTDLWVGYNIGVKKLLTEHKSLNRTFAAVRYFQKDFQHLPFQVGKGFDPFYNNKRALLGEVTFFRQEFYKTNYLYGFGTTEDVPYGYNIAVTAGWYRQMELSRPYLGINANRYKVRPNGSFLQTFVRSGIFPYRKKLEDASLMVGGSLYSKLYTYRNVKMREYIKLSFTRLSNRVVNEPLRINNGLGVRYLTADSLSGRQRLSIYTETFVFLKYKLFGFQLAPFVFADGSLLTADNDKLFKSDLYAGVGGGIRTRNENLVFGTSELRFVFFPRRAQDMNAFKLSFKGNIRFRYNSNYVRTPDFIQLNSEDTNSFY
ncbi:hypothetical protein EXU57_07355 [Segetibacter sp. 3557_3]|uniref:hypothetical protein n=1 Tax=Segetibacter sp. 3557_3 TaxID=2547429 RepID=UPI001058AB3A|nr:hypothetical protein [Segetibacter sp. 3557_3]TDH27394.1 hypothetical protein EXU57_07355 [Segetibacter sp. 3557_3]